MVQIIIVVAERIYGISASLLCDFIWIIIYFMKILLILQKLKERR